jgi:hypothetical protein
MTATLTKAFTISDWRPFVKNTLVAFFTITTPAGMVIHGCTLHRKDSARWVGMPAQKFAKEDGSTSFTPVIEFANRATADRFRDSVLLAIDAAGLGGER